MAILRNNNGKSAADHYYSSTTIKWANAIADTAIFYYWLLTKKWMLVLLL